MNITRRERGYDRHAIATIEQATDELRTENARLRAQLDRPRASRGELVQPRLRDVKP